MSPERAAAGLSAHVDAIRDVGYSVLPGVLTADEVADLSARLDVLVGRQVEEFGGAERIAAIGDTLTVRCPLAYDDQFLRLVTDERVLAVCRALLGDYVVLMQQNGIVNPSDAPHTQRTFHRDLPYQQFVSSRPLSISVLCCLDPFQAETGATTVVPRSHRVEATPAVDVAAASEIAVVATSGSCIVFDSMLVHRAGVNRSGRVRRAVNQVFALPFIAQQISLPAMLGGRWSDDAALARLLGYDTAPADSVVAWRERRWRRQQAAAQAR
jgi:ectoine hydroxylase-related dioxygenase (phytanoyl-CoA dioxygenase family)